MSVKCYACDAPATGTRDRRPEGGNLEPACERHAEEPKLRDVILDALAEGQGLTARQLLRLAKADGVRGADEAALGNELASLVADGTLATESSGELWTRYRLKAKLGRPRSPLAERYQVRMTADQRARWTALGERLGDLDLGAVLRVGAALLEHRAKSESAPQPGMTEAELLAWLTAQ